MGEDDLSTGRTTWIDRAIGRRLYEIRKEVGMTQEELARMLRMSFQQVQKYEKGVNRISAARLFVVSRALRVPYDWFFHNLQDENGIHLCEDVDPYGATPIHEDEKSEILSFFSGIPSSCARRSMLQGLRDLSRSLRS